MDFTGQPSHFGRCRCGVPTYRNAQRRVGIGKRVGGRGAKTLRLCGRRNHSIGRNQRRQAGKSAFAASVYRARDSDAQRRARHHRCRYRLGAHRAGARFGRLYRVQTIRYRIVQSGERRRPLHCRSAARGRFNRMGSQSGNHRMAV